jgi:hypothetical protein
MNQPEAAPSYLKKANFVVRINRIWQQIFNKIKKNILIKIKN